MQKKKSHHILLGIAAMIGIGGIVASVLMIKNQPVQTNYNYIKKEVEVINPVYKKKEEIVEKEIIRKNLIKDKQYYYDQLKDIVENKIKIDKITNLFLQVDFSDYSIKDLEDAIDIFNNNFFVIDVKKDSIENVILKNDTNYFQLFSIYEDFKVKEEFVVNQINLNEYFDRDINNTFINLKNPNTIQQTWIKLLSGRYKSRLQLDLKNTAIFKKSHQRYKEILQWNDATVNAKINKYVNQNFNQPNRNLEDWYRFLMDLQPTNPPVENQPNSNPSDTPNTNNTDPTPPNSNDTSTSQPDTPQDQPTPIENDPPQPPVSNEIVLERNEINTSLDKEINKTIINTPNTNLKEKFIEFKNQLQNEPNNDKHKKLLQDIKTFNDTLNEVYTKLNQLKENAQIKKVLDRFNENNNIITLIDGINDNNDIINEVNTLKTDYDTLINVGVEIQEEIIPNLNDAPELITSIIENEELNNTSLFRNKKDEINPYWLKINKILPKTQELYNEISTFMGNYAKPSDPREFDRSKTYLRESDGYFLNTITNNTISNVKDFETHKEEYKNNTSEIVEKTKQYYEKLKIVYEPGINNINENLDLGYYNNLYLNSNSLVDLFLEKLNLYKSLQEDDNIKTQFKKTILGIFNNLFNNNLRQMSSSLETFLYSKKLNEVNNNLKRFLDLLFYMDLNMENKFKRKFRLIREIKTDYSLPQNISNDMLNLYNKVELLEFFYQNKNHLYFKNINDNLKQELEQWYEILNNNIESKKPFTLRSNHTINIDDFNVWFNSNFETLHNTYNINLKYLEYIYFLQNIRDNLLSLSKNNNNNSSKIWDEIYFNQVNKLLYDINSFLSTFWSKNNVEIEEIENIVSLTKTNITNILNWIRNDLNINDNNKDSFYNYWKLNEEIPTSNLNSNTVWYENTSYKNKIQNILNTVNKNAENTKNLSIEDVVMLFYDRVIFKEQSFSSSVADKRIQIDSNLYDINYYDNYNRNDIYVDFYLLSKNTHNYLNNESDIKKIFIENNLNWDHYTNITSKSSISYKRKDFFNYLNADFWISNDNWLNLLFNITNNEDIMFHNYLKERILFYINNIINNENLNNLDLVPRFKELWERKENLTFEEIKELRKLIIVLEYKHKFPND